MSTTPPIYCPHAKVLFVLGDHGTHQDPVAKMVMNAADAAQIDLTCVETPWFGSHAQDALIRSELARIPSHRPLILGGFSRGARVTAGLVRERCAVAWFGLSFPFHPRHDPAPRLHSLQQMSAPGLLVQGARDAHGNKQQVLGYNLPPNIEIYWIEQANHALIPRRSSGLCASESLLKAQAVLARFFLQAIPRTVGRG